VTTNCRDIDETREFDYFFYRQQESDLRILPLLLMAIKYIHYISFEAESMDVSSLEQFRKTLKPCWETMG
jgi:hypothetical protein